MRARTPPPAGDVAVAILAGGLGTRLRSVVADRPKVLAPVAGRPFLAHWLDVLDAQGFRDVVLCTGHLAPQVEAAFGASHGRLRLRYSVEETPLGTGGALHQAASLLRSNPVLVLNGDSFCEVDLPAFLASHAASSADASLVVTQVPDIARFGSVQLGPDQRIQGFLEKTGRPGPGWINAGIYLFPRELFSLLPAHVSISLERDILPRWLHRGLHGFAATGRFIDIGTPESFAEAARFFGQPGTSEGLPAAA